MAKMFFSLGFWMTVLLFVMLGYAFAAECPPGSLNCYQRLAPADSQLNPNDSEATDVFTHRNCEPNAALRGNLSDFPQMANLQSGEPTYAPGFSVSLSRHRPQATVCTGAIQIPRH